ncbi:hypothetical protein EXIGLDRAFT_761060 [Exidia glandulosa HHB12029]|uniref:MYND-type domain-containing protein n=1 Tax=Exidia glandulosa HHB12029 TaxID=1314781 RepID=A0A165NPT0_EXIGL|nr:hypothetical protein EXIGLDRAFT_761060 [Exidia glandulosa HHB12029]
MAFVTNGYPMSISSRLALSARMLDNVTACPKHSPEYKNIASLQSVHKTRQIVQYLADAGSDNSTMFDNSLESAASVLAMCLRDLKYHERDKRFGNKRGLWPATADEMFPLGATHTITSLCAWYKARPGSTVFEVLELMRVMHWPLTCAGLHSGSNRIDLIDGIISCHESFARKYASVSPPCSQDDIESTDRQSLYTTHDFLAGLRNGMDSLADDFALFVEGREIDLYDALKPVLIILDTMNALHDDMCRVCAALLSLGPTEERQTARNEAPDFVKRELGIQAGTANDMEPYRRLYFWMPWHYRGCYGPNCRVRVHDTGRPFARCARCKLVQYCSKECQRRSWRGEEVAFSHQQVCDILQELNIFVHEDMDAEEFGDACRDNNFPMARARVIVAWRMSVRRYLGLGDPEEILAHIPLQAETSTGPPRESSSRSGPSERPLHVG